MIQFRCWYCHRKYAKPEPEIGKTLTCSCKNLLRVPTANGGKCRVKTIGDWIVEAIVCGGGGAVLGFGLALLIVSRLIFFGWTLRWMLLLGLPLLGFLGGLLFGERAIDFFGDMIRQRERE
jgi:hypothetical protein